MKKEISNSMSQENDPVFDVTIPLCAVCKNCLKGNGCKKYGEKKPDCKYGKLYNCKEFIPNEQHLLFDKVKDKIKKN